VGPEQAAIAAGDARRHTVACSRRFLRRQVIIGVGAVISTSPVEWPVRLE
jgi:hypothetical protein